MTARMFSGESSKSSMPLTSGMLQRKCACGQHTIAGSECEACNRKKQSMPQTACSAHESEVPTIVHQVLSSPGTPLGTETRNFFEPRLGRVVGESQITRLEAAPQRLSVSQPGDSHEQNADRIAARVCYTHERLEREQSRRGAEPLYDLSSIRMHTDERAAESASAV